jgi:Cys-Gly metallodipeptidase DUG1
MTLVEDFTTMLIRRTDNYWLDTKTPCLTYGLRGINYYEIRISGPGADLHSGVFGGTVHEPMTDLILLSEYGTLHPFVLLHLQGPMFFDLCSMGDVCAHAAPVSKLVSPTGEILIPGVKEQIAPVTEDERKKFEAIHFEMKDIHGAVGGDQTISEDTVTTLMGRMSERDCERFLRHYHAVLIGPGNPSLSLHGIEGAFCTCHLDTLIRLASWLLADDTTAAPGSKTVIPASVKGE